MRKNLRVSWSERIAVARSKALNAPTVAIPATSQEPVSVPVSVTAVTSKTKPTCTRNLSSLTSRRLFFRFNVVIMFIMLVILHILLMLSVLPTLKLILVTHSSWDRTQFMIYEAVPIFILMITSIILLYSLPMSSHKWPKLQLIIFAGFVLQLYYVLMFCHLFVATVYIDYGLCRWNPHIQLFKPMYDILTAAILNRLRNLENTRRGLQAEERRKLGYPDYKNITKMSIEEVTKWDHISPELRSLNCEYTFALFCSTTVINAIVVFLWSYFIILASKGIYIKPIRQNKSKSLMLTASRIKENAEEVEVAVKDMGDINVNRDKTVNKDIVLGGNMMVYNVEVSNTVQKTKSILSCQSGDIVTAVIDEIGIPNSVKVEYKSVPRKEPLLPFIMRKRFASMDSLTVFVDSDNESSQRSDVVVSSYHTSLSTIRSKKSSPSRSHSVKSYSISNFLQDFYSFFRAQRQKETEVFGGIRKLSKTQLYQIPKSIQNSRSANCLEASSTVESLLKTKRFFKELTLNTDLSFEKKPGSPDEDVSSKRSYTSHLGLGPSMKRSNRIQPVQICGICNGILSPSVCARSICDSESTYNDGSHECEDTFCSCNKLKQFRKLSNEFQKKRLPSVDFQTIF